MLLSSQMKEIASNKGEKVQPQVCVAGLSQRKFSVNDLQVQENCSHEPISGRGGCRFSDTGEKVQVTKLRAIMAKAVFNPKKKLKIITAVSFIRKHDADITGV